ncbi:MAG: response regulator [bacterium]|nr:response regulator [bacterium]
MNSTRVMLLDDDSRYLEVIQFSLESADMTVDTAVSGAGLSARVERFAPDVLVMDVMLGEHNGIALARAFREESGRYDLPIVFVSAWTGTGELRLPGNSVMLFKPFTPNELIKAIGDALRGQQVTADNNVR